MERITINKKIYESAVDRVEHFLFMVYCQELLASDVHVATLGNMWPVAE